MHTTNLPASGDDPVDDSGKNPLDHYRRLLAKKTSQTNESTVEGIDTTTELDLTNPGIQERLEETNITWRGIIKKYLGDKPLLYEIADQITHNADEALRVVRDNDLEKIRQKPEILDHLEAIVRTDGSRPSFIIRNGHVDKNTSPLGDWSGSLDASAGLLQSAIACVGRIDDPTDRQGFRGTGFIVAPNLIITNRHVLQLIADKLADQSWQLHSNIHIDFGHEFRGQKTLNRRALKRIVFAGADPISSMPPVDHKKLDLALIELAPVSAGQMPLSFLAVDEAPDWSQAELGIYTIGYPGDPLTSIPDLTLLEQLFHTTYGCKRLAPGRVMTSRITTELTTSAHDATTLGGNSGSVVLVINREQAAAGLHYGGRSGEPRENWAHILGTILDRTNGHEPTTLREYLVKGDAEFINRP